MDLPVTQNFNGKTILANRSFTQASAQNTTSSTTVTSKVPGNVSKDYMSVENSIND